MEVVAEANSFVDGWGQVIFPTANEMIANEKMRAAFEKIPETKAALELKYDVKPKASLTSPTTPSASKTANGVPIPNSAATPLSPSSDAEASPLSANKKTKKRK